MLIFPAIDLRDGRVVRLARGDYRQTTVYASDPAGVARDFEEKGARCLHVVDLDGAKDGGTPAFRTVEAIRAATGAYMELGGGVRDEARVARYLEIGVNRVILGTAAAQNPAFAGEMAKKYGERIAVGVDARDGFVAVGGWLETTKLRADEFCARLRDLGVRAVIFTDIARDGMLSGVNLTAYRAIAAVGDLEVVASGGVSGEEDVRALRDAGAPAAIVGKALYTGALTLPRALAVARGED